ncbi:hypothetical protein ACFVU4_04185 [Streptomyces sp. NPDC058107]|uniref:hypothetical protein n=1 Tax=Streptomyces sp. NPDC058107 TaxID=3346343 RepID=UPI0036E9C11A
MASHPGWSSTNLQNNNATWVLRAFGKTVNRLFGQDAAAGALPSLYAATQDLPGASYVGPDGRGEWRGAPTPAGRSARAGDPEAARRLWTVGGARVERARSAPGKSRRRQGGHAEQTSTGRSLASVFRVVIPAGDRWLIPGTAARPDGARRVRPWFRGLGHSRRALERGHITASV